MTARAFMVFAVVAIALACFLFPSPEDFERVARRDSLEAVKASDCKK